MALPDNALSSEPMPAAFAGGRALPISPRLDFETGGVAFNDPSQGLQVRVWRCRINDDGTQVLVDHSEIEHSPIVLYSGADITEVSLTFDQNMRPQLAFVEGGNAKLRWFDPQASGNVVTNWGATYITPRVSLDDKRRRQSSISDVIFAYLRGGNLYHRRQRDRYQTEILLAQGVTSPGLIKIGMNRGNRFQFLMENP